MKKKTDLTYEAIKERIISGEYPPMSELTEDSLQQEFKCSRTPVREAFIKLAENGFINIYVGKATLVSPISQELIEEIYEIRLLLEPHIAIRASAFIPEDLLKDLRIKFTKAPEFEETKDRRSYFINCDELLHTSILNYCGNSFLIKAMKLIYDHNARFRNFSSNPTLDGSINEHLIIIDSLISRDPLKIEQAVLSHIKASKNISINAYLNRTQELNANRALEKYTISKQRLLS